MNKASNKSCSIIIPCFNESNNLEKLIDLCKTNLCSRNIEVILIDNGSTDSSQNILSKIPPKDNYLKTYRLRKNLGYGHGILFGLSKAHGDFLGWTHADLQTDPLDVVEGFELINNTNEFVKGTRKGRPLLDNFITIGMSFFESILFKNFLWDINAQPTLFHRSFFEIWQDPPKDWSIDLFAYSFAKKNGLTVKRIEVLFPDRIAGTSSWNTGLASRIYLIIRTISSSRLLRMKFKDLSSFENSPSKNNKG